MSIREKLMVNIVSDAKRNRWTSVHTKLHTQFITILQESTFIHCAFELHSVNINVMKTNKCIRFGKFSSLSCHWSVWLKNMDIAYQGDFVVMQNSQKASELYPLNKWIFIKRTHFPNEI